MNLENLTNEELLELASMQKGLNEAINNEWIKRNKLNFPYKIIEEKIYNSIIGEFIDKENCDKLILQQFDSAINN